MASQDVDVAAAEDLPEVGPRPHEVAVDELLDVGAGLRRQPQLEDEAAAAGTFEVGEAVPADRHGVDGALPLLSKRKMQKIQILLIFLAPRIINFRVTKGNGSRAMATNM